MYEINNSFRARRKDFIKNLKRYSKVEDISELPYVDASEFRLISPREQPKIIKKLKQEGSITVKTIRTPVEKKILTLTPKYLKERELRIKKYIKTHPILKIKL
jgi:hypothetical protein